MKSSQKPAVYKFHSVHHLYQDADEPDLQLEILEYGADAVEVKLSNTRLPQQKRIVKKHILAFMLASSFYLWMYFEKILQLAYVEILLAFWFVSLLWRISNLVECGIRNMKRPKPNPCYLSKFFAEKFLLCYDFGIYLQTQRFLGKSSRFVASYNIYDIRINEVIENLDFRYLLIIRTKGKLFHTNCIIPMFKVFKPSCDCLSLIYKHLNKVLVREPSPSSSQQL